jgi:hypothetical protein
VREHRDQAPDQGIHLRIPCAAGEQGSGHSEAYPAGEYGKVLLEYIPSLAWQ